jgi:hypothetical protein
LFADEHVDDDNGDDVDVAIVSGEHDDPIDDVSLNFEEKIINNLIIIIIFILVLIIKRER